MGIEIEPIAVLYFGVGLAALYGIGWLLLVPMKVVLRFLFNGILGGGMLMLLNLFGSPWGLYVAVNPLTALTAGFLGVPGVGMLMLLERIL